MSVWKWTTIVLISLRLFSTGMVLAGEVPAAEGEASVRLNPNVPTKTLGGRQFWADVASFHDWRIQLNVYTKHYRLLDGSDVRQAWGTLAQCQEKLAEIRKERKLAPQTGEMVVLVHGICRSSKSMSKLNKYLRSQGLQTYGFDYPSTRVPVEESADYLHEVIASMEGVEKVHLVGFSLGGLVVRSYLHRHPSARTGRVLLIGTPNRGAELADTFRGNLLFKMILGPAGQQLSATTSGVAATLPAPPGEFAVIAGVRNTDAGYNPFITGDDDGTVSLSSVRLKGACDFMTVPALHTFLLTQPETLTSTYCFLREGRLRAEGERQPIVD